MSSHISRRFSIFLIAGAATLVVACGTSGTDAPPVAIGDGPSNNPAVPAGAAPAQAAVPAPTQSAAPSETPSDTPVATPASSTPGPTEPAASEDQEDKGVQAASDSTATPGSEWNIEDAAERSRAVRLQTLWRWETNFKFRKVGLLGFETVLPRDRIIPIDDPTFIGVSDAPAYMKPREPVISVVVNGEAKAYPLAILMWHEIVNDAIGGKPVTVTFCPLCNAGITFERVVEGRELTFGTSGMLRNSDLVMWDRQTQSWWQQFTGEALVGDFAATDAVLTFVPSQIIAWETFADAYPDGKLLERIINEFGQPLRPYDSPPYAGYDDVDNQPFLFSGIVDRRLVATSRVLTIDGETPVAYPFSFLSDNPVLNDSVGDTDIVAFFDDGTLSAFGGRSGEPQTSGSATAFSRTVGDRTLTFELTDLGITDVETGSVWNLVGIAISGELKGTQLTPVIHASHFWFAWAVFKPETEVRDSVEDLTA
ncbi:MAG: DUF3179 domain-containing protein [Chloroflexi bacterium]|nr:DUF3179 domain-containing protein [Chloroflexota bacterium]